MKNFFQSFQIFLFAVITVLFDASRSFAQQTTAPVAAGEQPSLFGALVQMLPMLAICYLIFYFMVIKPQETKTKKQRDLLESIKKGDSVVTTSGIVGRVSGVEGDHIILEIASNVKVKFLRSHIARFETEPQKA